MEAATIPSGQSPTRIGYLVCCGWHCKESLKGLSYTKGTKPPFILPKNFPTLWPSWQCLPAPFSFLSLLKPGSIALGGIGYAGEIWPDNFVECSTHGHNCVRFTDPLFSIFKQTCCQPPCFSSHR
jgi:hypothetical protein